MHESNMGKYKILNVHKYKYGLLWNVFSKLSDYL